MKCDLCGGDPICVKVCGTGAIKLVKPEKAYSEKRVEKAKEIISAFSSMEG
jgi:Fe-S-cluster-containing hydrogenase component 2